MTYLTHRVNLSLEFLLMIQIFSIPLKILKTWNQL